LINLAISENRKGNFFPVFGICNGIEIINIVVANNVSVIDNDFDNSDVT
jgi:gamma-glutamyl-gamma-aminobutyrate hydrolase PuuD